MINFLKEKNPGLYRFIIGMCILTAIALGFVFIRVWHRRSLGFTFLVWNIFLAWVPFYLSIILTQYEYKSKILKSITAFFWLMFYPNAPYIITDFIHLSAYNFYKSEVYAFNNSYRIWYDFFLISIFVITGLILAYTSLRLVHNCIKKRYGNLLGWISIAMVSILSGYAIYLGRFIRVNSWEIATNPFQLIGVLFENINTSGLIYSLLFGVMIFFIYLSFGLLGGFNEGEILSTRGVK